MDPRDRRAFPDGRFIRTWTGLFSLKTMSICPICDELTVNKDVLALGCGHILCSDCLESVRQLGDNMECPFCKARIFESEVRRLYLHQADPKGRFSSFFFELVVLSTQESTLLDNAVGSAD